MALALLLSVVIDPQNDFWPRDLSADAELLDRLYVAGLTERPAPRVYPAFAIDLERAFGGEGEGATIVDRLYEPVSGLRLPVAPYAFVDGGARQFVFPAAADVGLGSLEIHERADLFAGRYDASLPLWDARAKPDYDLYVWDDQPIVGPKDLFDVRFERGYAAFNMPWGTVATGRMDLRVGPMYRYPVTFSGFARPFDFVHNSSLWLGPVRMSAAFAVVPDTVPNRRLAYQRVELPLGPVSVAVSDGVLSSRADGLKYLNPFAVIYEMQRRTDNADNLFLAADFVVRPFVGLALYGEFFADDPSFFYEGSAEQAPLWAMALGAHAVYDETNDLCVEFAESPPWSYAHATYTNTFGLFGVPMGLSVGPDSRNLFVQYSRFFGLLNAVRLFGELSWRGEAPFGVPWEDSGGADPHGPWPTGVVEKRRLGGVRVDWRASRLALSAAVSLLSVENEGNVVGARGVYGYASLFVSLRGVGVTVFEE